MLRRTVAAILVLGAVAAIWSTIEVRRARRYERELEARAYEMPVADKQRVWVRRLPSDDPWLFIWRMHLPENFAPLVASVNGDISATSNLVRFASSITTSFHYEQDAEYSLRLEPLGNGRFAYHFIGPTFRSRSQFSIKEVDALEAAKSATEPATSALVIEAAGQDEIEAFAGDAAFRLFRVRGRAPRGQARRLTDAAPEDLFSGMAVYVVPSAGQAAFEASTTPAPEAAPKNTDKDAP